MAHMQTNESIARPRCVALVDDEVQITQALQTLLSLKGVPTSVHHSAESLLQALQVRDGTDEPVVAYARERHVQQVRRKYHPSDGVRRRSGSKSQEPIPGEGPSCNP